VQIEGEGIDSSDLDVTVESLVLRSRAAQGFAATVETPNVLALVAAILRGAVEDRQAAS
jgi:hypothetical protein